MGLIRMLILGALVWWLVRLVKGLISPARTQTQGRPQASGELPGGELVQDPQCGVYIPKETALKGPGGQLFCSSECRDAYRDRKA